MTERFYSVVVSVDDTQLPIDVADLKTYLRQDNTDEDTVIQSILLSAIHEAEAYLQIALLDQERAIRITGTPPRELRLDYPPVYEIVSVKYLDTSLVWQTLDPSSYVLENHVLYPVGDTNWPQVSTTRQNGFIVSYRCALIHAASPAHGHGHPHLEAFPKNLELAIFMLAQIIYDRNPTANPTLKETAYRLLDQWRLGQGV